MRGPPCLGKLTSSPFPAGCDRFTAVLVRAERHAIRGEPLQK
jgi:hypothetical protein